MEFREHTLEKLAQIGLQLFNKDFENYGHHKVRIKLAQFLYEELYERATINRVVTSTNGIKLPGFPGYKITLLGLRNDFGINKIGYEESKYPFDESLKNKLIETLKGNWDYEEVKQRLILPNKYNYTNDFKTRELETQIIYIFENLSILQQQHLGLNNTTNFMSRAEISRKLILIVCEYDKGKISEMLERIEYDTNQYNPTFDSTLNVFENYYNEFCRKTIYINKRKTYPIIEQCKSSIRHNFAGPISTSKDLLPQVLNGKVADLLNDYLAPVKKSASEMWIISTMTNS